MGQSKRARYLRKQQERRDRAGRITPDSNVKMRFRCSQCGTEVAHPGNILLGPMTLTDDRGEVHQVPTATWTTPCPACGGKAVAINQTEVTVNGLSVSGFADTDADIEVLKSRLEELRRSIEGLDPDSSVEDIAVEIENQAPELSWFANWLRSNQDLFGAIQAGGTLVGLVLALLALILPMTNDGSASTPPEAPPGITHQQMEKLLTELETRNPNHQHPKGEGSSRNHQSAERQHPGVDHNGEDRNGDAEQR